MVEYLVLIDRTTHLAYVAAVAVAVVYVALLHWNVVHTGHGDGALNVPQALKIVNSLATLMKDCNVNLPVALCQVLSTPDMTAYHYLTNLDFVKDVSGCKTHFGRIPQVEVRFPHLQVSKTGSGTFQGWSSPRFFK